MAFRKRNVAIVGRTQPPVAEKPTDTSSTIVNTSRSPSIPGVRSSPVDGRPVTSTGTPSLDSLFAGHSGFILGSSLLLEEDNFTDYAGILLRYFAAEGVVQEHKVHVIGYGPSWGKELPGLAPTTESGKSQHSSPENKERMKIAWRYQNLGEFGAEPRRVSQKAAHGTSPPEDLSTATFCHSFDLTKRLALPPPAAVNYIALQRSANSSSPFSSVLARLTKELTTAPNAVHRILVSSILSPALYPPEACMPEHILQFLKALNALLKRHASHACCMMSLPTALFPRTTGLTRWIELLSDGVFELIPFPHEVDIGPSPAASGATTAQEEKPQGIFRVHRLPAAHEMGRSAANAGVGDDLVFTVTRKRFQIKPFSLPPLDGDVEAQKAGTEAPDSKESLEF